MKLTYNYIYSFLLSCNNLKKKKRPDLFAIKEKQTYLKVSLLFNSLDYYLFIEILKKSLSLLVYTVYLVIIVKKYRFLSTFLIINFFSF